MNLVVLCPHFAPDVAPTGEVMTRIAMELVERGHRLHVVTALPWYQRHALEPGWDGQLVRGEVTEWGRISRVHPFPTDKRNIPARALAFGGFTALAAAVGAVVEAEARRRAGHVAAAHPRPRGSGRRHRPSGAVGVQHPGRLPRRRRRARAAQGPPGDRGRQLARAHLLPALRRRHRAVRRPGRQRAHQDHVRPRRRAGRPGGREGPGHPELRRHRPHPPRRPRERLPGRVRPQRPQGRDVRRQRRLLPVARPRAARRPLASPCRGPTWSS